MTEHFIDLTDGTRLEVKVNFGTMYYLQKCKGFYRITKKIEKAKQEGIQQDKILSEQEGFEMAANIVYAVLRSNGKPVKFDEALALVPPDLEELKEVIQGFQEEDEKYSKKKEAKQMTTPAR